MRVLAINGSPRNNNTAQLLQQALKGAELVVAETELINLYDLNYRGCISCFGCKRKDAVPCKCFMKDDLTAILEKVHSADVLLLGSPIYFGDVTGQMRCFLERLSFPAMTYDDYNKKLFNGQMNVAFFFTMNVGNGYEEMYKPIFENNTNLMKKFGGTVEYYLATDTLQFNDYSKYQSGQFDENAKRQRHNEQFPRDLENAYEIGKRLAAGN
jgi:multimeric flavodoxin WrbA